MKKREHNNGIRMMNYGGGGCTFHRVLLENFTEEMMFEHKHKMI